MKIAKSLKWFSLVLALVLAMSGSALAYSDRNLEAPKAKDVVIDGDLSEWDLTRCLTIDSESQIVDQIEHWDGAEDCSMEIYAMWDEENLYIAARVKDDTPFVYREGFPLERNAWIIPAFVFSGMNSFCNFFASSSISFVKLRYTSPC